MSDGAVRYLPPLPGHDEGTRGTVTNHRMREVTEQVAQRGIWDGGVLDEVRALFDSLALIELVEALEEEFSERSAGFRIDDDDLDDLKTVRDAVDYVVSRLG